jgi:primosomal replication protein N''
MSEPMLVRFCPNCKTERPATEVICENLTEQGPCHWELLNEPPYPRGHRPGTAREDAAPSPVRSIQCLNGHPMGSGDQMCLACGADPASQPEGGSGPPDAPEPETLIPDEETAIGGWRLLRRLPVLADDAQFESFVAQAESGGPEVSLVLYQPRAEPDQAVYEILRRVPIDHIPTLITTGRHDNRAYEVTELINGPTLQAAGYIAGENPELLRSLVKEGSDALASFAQWGLRHRDLHPANIRIRSLAPLDLVVTGFGSARLSDFDLEAVAPLELTRYSAPEAIVGAVSAASDWWSLGVIILEQATAGRCFAQVNDQAFRLHVVTRGISLGDDLDPNLHLLLRGLLARDPNVRWSAIEVRAWLAGEPVEAPSETTGDSSASDANPILLGGLGYGRPATFALAAAEAVHWDEAKELVLRGAVATWLETIGSEGRLGTEVRRIVADASTPDDFRHALSLMVLNEALPLTARGEIVTPNWLMAHPQEGYSLITSEVIQHLERIGRESWLVRLGYRIVAVRERAEMLEIALEEETLRITALASSRAALDAERDALRRVYPDTDHPGLASILDRAQLSDEEAIILISAARDQFLPLASLLAAATDLATQVSVSLDRSSVSQLLPRSRREIFDLIDERIANFARCGIERVDDWADAFRIERRMPLPRAAVLLSVPAAQWQPPPKQQYIKTLLDHFERRVSTSVARGPLVKFTISKSSARVDLFELGTSVATADSLLDHILRRDDIPKTIDPAAYAGNEALEARLRRLVNHAATFRRDTGLDGRTLGFPFLLVADSRGGSGRTAAMKLAPVLLWPVALELGSGVGQRRTATIAFDRAREEVRLNPALESILEPAQLAQWRAAREELLRRSTIQVRDVIDVFGALASPRGRALVRLPTSAPASATRIFDLVPSATVFNAEFTGQSVAADLRDIGRKIVANTALEAMIRVTELSAEVANAAPSTELSKFTVVASDPSQDLALQQSRVAPGLLVEGPPGTGKSQTIVNVVTDAIGRGETVLVVCQKQAALRVVKKRLDAEQLEDRSFHIVDSTRDREMIIRALRAQLTAVRSLPDQQVLSLQARRAERAARIEGLEKEVDAHHQALHRVEPAIGASYRQLLAELVKLKADGPVIDSVGLRTILGGLDTAAVAVIEDECGGLANLWLASNYENSALMALKDFSVDETVAVEISARFASYVDAEEERRSTLAAHKDAFDTNDPAPYIDWLEQHRSLFEQMSEEDRRQLAKWLDLFREHEVGRSKGRDTLALLGELTAAFEALPGKSHDDVLFSTISGLSPVALRQLLVDTSAATHPSSFFGRLNPLRWRSVSRSRAFLKGLGEATEISRIGQLRDALALEVSLRPLRQRMTDLRALLGVQSDTSPSSLEKLRHDVRSVASGLLKVAVASRAVFECPRSGDAERMALAASAQAFHALSTVFAGAKARHEARQTSLMCLNQLDQWFPADWLGKQAAAIASNAPDRAVLASILEALPTIVPFQQFRRRVKTRVPATLAVFADLRKSAARLRDVPGDQLEELVKRTVGYASRIAWKARLEEQHDELLLETAEIERKVGLLGELDREMRNLNREALRHGVEARRLGSVAEWDNITRLRGPRALRLREIIGEGADLGLMHMRPIWIMNPDVASRILPMKAGLFDLVVFDEASQMQVEHALPTLFRAKRVLVSGDEKQMPPSSFFASRIDGDDDGAGDIDFSDEAATETERLAKAEAWNRKEVKDCPDLLQLGRSTLPTSTLQIHYRSKYRELISFSNFAYYQGGLNVPVRHPEAEVRRVRPIEVVRVNGVYAEQSNEEEAEAVVSFLAKLWATPADERPSIGVVTFNRKQADTIEDALAVRCDEDADFKAAYDREVDREQNGEDMGFFVKNVENVQGDERDVIIFSTTFGRDRHGTFRRNFGVLSQAGGERRLNVAVTRARERVVVVTSMPVADISDWLSSGRRATGPRDFLQAYLYYAEQVSSGALDLAKAATSKLSPTVRTNRREVTTLDGFSQDVQSYVRSLGFEPVAAADGDAFSLDFAIENPNTKLFSIGIECDAPVHDLLRTARAREIWRPSVLKRAIGTVHRVSSSAWFHRPNEERMRLATAIREAMQQGAQP